ncbi:alkaline phosphatase family protein [Nocardioides sp. zg-536]|uniref:Alkaline phosphatase family protein n=1 Tax=Nocardioides faecalis TaxID=2803858 RepID=A0A939BZ63_9ACTN|nr:endonuclease/exonuclease/phosphatase family protein [Nocardioides faecalis]MBM9460705.1 alkaline phosphatase family protein [Nocardioides faecalis]MBS4752644.1 alkaline phosphatase family protein [Nocardioides faecalis]QVI57910.1 alkaline phosphatase family protein [Nocardioides faecalis]
MTRVRPSHPVRKDAQRRSRLLRRGGAALGAGALLVGLLHAAPASATPAAAPAAAPQPAPRAAAPAPAPTKFRIATFNVLGHSHTVKGGDRYGKYAGSGTRMRSAVKALQDNGVQVVGFQEFEPKQVASFQKLAGPGWSMWPGTAIKGESVTSIAWRSSVWTAVERTTYRAPYFHGKMRQRPLVLLRHNSTGQLVWMLNTHNPANSWGDAQKYRDKAERIQAALVNKLRAQYPTVPVLFTGDMNDRDRFYCPVTYLTDLQSASGGYHDKVPGGVCQPTKPVMIDWVMGTPDVAFSNYRAVRDATVKAATDHPLVMADGTVAPSPERAAGIQRVVVIDVQGLRSSAIGASTTPYISRMLQRGAFTLNARTDAQRRTALPNTISILSGRPVRTSKGGHGVRTARDPRVTVHKKAGQYVSTIFDISHNLGMRTAFYSGDPQSKIVTRTWSKKYGGADTYGADNGRHKLSRKVLSSDTGAVRAARSDLAKKPARVTFVQLGGLDRTASKKGWKGGAYSKVLKRADRQVGSLLNAIARNSATASSTLVVLTSSSGGPASLGRGVPIIVNGPGVVKGDLYALNRGYTNPGAAANPAKGTPLRTGVIANLVAAALSLPRVPRSVHNSLGNLRVLQ